jgi:p-hydroxybenzoate 3-monooxygenase
MARDGASNILARPMKAQVAIIGAGPAGLLLSQILHSEGIESIVVERQSRSHVEGRIRAGVLERITVEMLERAGAADRMHREGLVHHGFKIIADGEPFRIDMLELTDSSVLVYGQTELTRDLIDTIMVRGGNIEWEVEAVALHDIETDRPRITFRQAGTLHEIQCDFIAGCDGYHGVSRTCIPAGRMKLFERQYPFGWLGILADVPPCHGELIYSNHERGFALASMRSPTRSRYYLQCSLEERLEEWPDDRIWNELAIRLGAAANSLTRGASIEKSIAPVRSLVAEPMQYGRLFLAGDAAHIVPPAGAKGLNLAVSDVYHLSRALTDYYRSKNLNGLLSYSQRALARVWKAERFSWWFTNLTHRFPDMDPFIRKMQSAELAYIRESRAAQITMAENYVGLPVQ